MGFTFSAGNLAKLARIPYYLAGRAATLLIPRATDRWVFGCAVGVADGALALWEQVAAAGHRALWLIDDARDVADARARGITWARRHSVRGFWETARAGVIVVTHGFGDVNRYAVSGAFIVQLWHGIPLKRIGLDSPATVRSALPVGAGVVERVIAALYAATTRGIRLLPAASDLVRGRLESAFSLPDQRVPVTGEPRVDVLSQGSPAARRSRARNIITDAAGPLPSDDTRLILYAPTWRDGADDPVVPTPADWDAITSMLDRTDAVLLVRSHPLGAGEYIPPVASERIRMLGTDVLRDATPALPGLDVLVSDYSSMAYDAGLVALPVVYLAPDVAEYARTRGFYGRYEDVAGDDYAVDWSGAVSQLLAVLGDDDERRRRADRSAALSARVHRHRDGRNAERVYREIAARRRNR